MNPPSPHTEPYYIFCNKQCYRVHNQQANPDFSHFLDTYLTNNEAPQKPAEPHPLFQLAGTQKESFLLDIDRERKGEGLTVAQSLRVSQSVDLHIRNLRKDHHLQNPSVLLVAPAEKISLQYLEEHFFYTSKPGSVFSTTM